MHTKWMRGSFIVLVLVALLGLVLVACHKKEGAEQSGIIAAPAVAPAAPAPALQPASPKAEVAALVGKRVPRITASTALPTPALPEGEEPLPEGIAPEGTVEGPLTVVVSELPLAGPPSQEVIHRVRAHKEPFVVTPNPGVDSDQNLQDASDPNTPPSGLLGAADSRAQIDPGSPAVAFVNWSGEDTNGVPFDVDMAVGPNHIVTDVNTEFKVHNKLGTLLAGPTGYQSFWSGLTNCGAGETATNFLADPQIVYDDELDRWVMITLRAQVTSAGAPVSSQICLACSQGADPTGAWYKYEISDGTGLADYPHLGVGEDAIFVGTNHFSSTAYDNAHVRAINKTQAYAGTTPTTIRKALGASYFTPQPAERRGSAQAQYPPSGTPHFFVVMDGSGDARVFRWSFPSMDAGSTLTDFGLLQAWGGTPPDITGSNITNTTIDGNDERIMDAELRWPNLWYTRGGIATQGSIMWAGANVSGSAPSVIQSGEYSDANRTFHWSDCTVDKNNNFAIGFTAANNATTVFPSAYITGREQGITADNTLEAYRISQAGTAKYQTWETGTARWGDYCGVAVDPNGCDIWYHGEYTATTVSGAPYKKTYVQKYKFPSCTAGATRQAYLDKAFYFCVDTVNGTIIDTAGTPTNAVYHCSDGTTVAGIISGTGPTYTVSPTTITALSGADTNTIWLSFTGDDAVTYNSSNAAVDCTSQVCTYIIDPLSGGCDNDTYPDEGETLNVNIALANYESYNLPGPIEATLSLVGSDPNVTIVSGTAYYPALETMTYSYPTVPFSIRYTGAYATNCMVDLQFQVAIKAADNAWTSSGCTAGTDLVNTSANTDDVTLTPIISQSFDAATIPSGWAQTQVAGTGLATFVNAGTQPTCTPHSGTYMVKYDCWNYAAGTAARLYHTAGVDLSAYGKANAAFWMYHSGTYTNADTTSLQASDDGTTWTTLVTATRNNPNTLAWIQHTGDLGAFSGAGHTAVRVGLLMTSAYGLNMFLDDLTVSPVNQICETAACAGAPLLAYDQYAFADAGCNANDYMDPGEVGVLSLYLNNTGNEWAYGTTATLTCPTCPAGWGTICDNTAVYGNIPYGTTYVYAPTSDTFTVAIDSAFACGAVNAPIELPFVVTVNATNPYGPLAINAPVLVGGPKIFNPTANNQTYEEHFTLDPGTAGAGGRGGFTTAWTESSATRTTSSATTSGCATSDLDGYACGFNNTASITHLFSTVGIDQDLEIRWEWEIGRQPTTGGLRLEYTVNGSTWTELVTSAGSNTPTTPDWECWGGSMYASADPTEQCYGTGCILGNPNFGLRFSILGNNATTNPDGYVDNLRLTGYSYQCTTTSCTGTCPSAAAPPAVPADSQVPGTALQLTRNGSNVDVIWDASCTGATDYRILWGDVNTLSLTSNVTNGTVTDSTCNLGLTGTATNVTSPTPASGHCLFAIIDGVTGTEFGRHGNNSWGNEILLSGDTTFCGATTKNTTRTTCSTFAAAPEYTSEAPSMKPVKLQRQPVRKECGKSVTEPETGKPLPVMGRVQ